MHKDAWRDLREPHERLQWARENAGFSNPADAAEALGFSGSRQSTHFAHENGSRGLVRAGARYAEFFRVSFDWLMRGKGSPNLVASARATRPADHREVPIVGRVGAGPEGSIEFAEASELGSAPYFEGSSENTVAVEVWGNSMRPIVQEGWLVYYEDRRGGLTPAMFGQPCVIGLASGHTVLKTPYQGSRKGVYHLESANPAIETMRDQQVKWAALVTAIVPRVPAQKLMKRARGRVST